MASHDRLAAGAVTAAPLRRRGERSFNSSMRADLPELDGYEPFFTLAVYR